MRLQVQRNDCCPLSDDSVWTDRLSFRKVTAGAIILSETLLGALGNFSLLYHYLLLYCTEGWVRPIDLILLHLTIANSLLIALHGVRQTMETLELKHFFSDLGCRLLFYVQRVGRSVSVGTTCLLSVFQAIMMSPRDSCWKYLKIKAPQYASISVSLCWTFYMFINLIFPLHVIYVASKWRMKNITRKTIWGYCHVTSYEEATSPLYLALIVLPEVSFSVLIVWASGSMILFLHRHKQRVQHIHSNHVSSSSSAESRATQRILVLVSAFLCFYTLSSLLHLFLVLFHDKNGWLLSATSIISLCFPSLSPFLVMRHDVTVFRLFFALNMTKRSHDHTPKSSKHRFWNNIQLFTQALF